MVKESGIKERTFVKPTGRWVLALAIIAALGTAGVAIYSLTRVANLETPTPDPSAPAAELAAVSALGRLEPQGETIQLSAPTQNFGGGARVEQLLVEEGAWVQTGQVVAILDSRDRLQAALVRSQTQVKVAQTRLAQVEAGAKTGDINAQRNTIKLQQASIARSEAELRNAQIEYRRYQQLYQDGAISQSQLDSKRLVMETTEAQVREAKAALEQAKATLNSIAEVRPTDIAAAQADVESARSAVRQAEADLALAYVRSPITGQVLKIQTRPGEVASSDGIVSLGRTNQMYAVAEVYENDITSVRPGQRATITSSALPNPLHGIVDQIGQEIGKKDVLDTDPAADIDARVVEVKIRLDPEDSKQVAGLTNLQVEVKIDRQN